MISVIFLLTSLFTTWNMEPGMIIEKKSITIDGDTSLGGFSCEYEVSGVNDTLFINDLSTTPYGFSIPVEEFRCGNFLLNNDFRSTLKAKEYPEISVQVLSLDKRPNGTLEGTLMLSLVGKSKILNDINFTVKAVDDKYALTTDFIFLASEFDLTPPSKFGGLIKTDDAMHITVALFLKSIW